MSGGKFNYDQYNILNIADEIERSISDENLSNEYSEETIDKIKQGIKILKEAYTYAHRIDWLLSGDDGEESFHRTLKEDLEKL